MDQDRDNLNGLLAIKKQEVDELTEQVTVMKKTIDNLETERSLKE